MSVAQTAISSPNSFDCQNKHKDTNKTRQKFNTKPISISTNIDSKISNLFEKQWYEILKKLNEQIAARPNTSQMDVTEIDQENGSQFAIQSIYATDKSQLMTEKKKSQQLNQPKSTMNINESNFMMKQFKMVESERGTPMQEKQSIRKADNNVRWISSTDTLFKQ